MRAGERWLLHFGGASRGDWAEMAGFIVGDITMVDCREDDTGRCERCTAPVLTTKWEGGGDLCRPCERRWSKLSSTGLAVALAPLILIYFSLGIDGLLVSVGPYMLVVGAIGGSMAPSLRSWYARRLRYHLPPARVASPGHRLPGRCEPDAPVGR